MLLHPVLQTAYHLQIGSQLPDSIAKSSEPVPESEKTDLRKDAESTWGQAQIAGKGIYNAAASLASNVSENVHRAVDHNFGKEADAVAKGELDVPLVRMALMVACRYRPGRNQRRLRWIVCDKSHQCAGTGCKRIDRCGQGQGGGIERR